MRSPNVVLVVDDDEDLRVVLCELITGEGYRVVQATNGREALDAIESGLRPCLILLDLMMPTMSGWEFMTARSGTAAAIPVCVITAYPQNDVPSGTLGTIQKPFDFDHILELLQRHCPLADME